MTESSDYLILFGDLVDSTDVAVETSPSFFARTYIASFHWAATKAFEFIKRNNIFREASFSQTIEQIKIAGDQVHTFTRLDPDLTEDNLQDVVASAVSFAYITKLYWLAAPYNLARLLGKQFPRDISWGIHIGPAAAVDPSKVNSDVAGLHINMTKRIETSARSGTQSRIFASPDVTHLFAGWSTRLSSLKESKRPPLLLAAFEERDQLIEGKGVPKKLRILELTQADASMESVFHLLDHLKTSPEREDVEAEKAARILGQTFLKTRRQRLFEGFVEYHIPQADTVGGYIEKWYEALRYSPKIFFDEPWLVLNCFVVSGALMRHPSLSKAKRRQYEADGANLHDRLVSLIKARQSK